MESCPNRALQIWRAFHLSSPNLVRVLADPKSKSLQRSASYSLCILVTASFGFYGIAEWCASIGFRTIQHLKMAVWTSLLWKNWLEIVNKWPFWQAGGGGYKYTINTKLFSEDSLPPVDLRLTPTDNRWTLNQIKLSDTLFDLSHFLNFVSKARGSKINENY